MDVAVARPASTVIVLREADRGPEVLLLRRTRRASFVGGAFVFPGGALDDADADAAWEGRCVGRSEAEARALLGVERAGLAWWVAALRELFEEAGVLVAAGEHGPVRLDEAVVADRFAGHRERLRSGEEFRAIVEAEGLVLPVGEVGYWSHWITPEQEKRRFDTRFFVARAPEGQEAGHDRSETVESVWLRPAEALDRHRRGDLAMIFPTIRHLEELASFGSVDAVLAEAAGRRDVPAIQPRIVFEPDGFRILLPGDPGFDEAG